MKWSLNAGRLFGIKFRIHVTFFLLLLYVFFSDIKAGFGQAGLSVLFVCAIFACVVIHELSHSLVARRFGREPKSITLLPIGGVAAIDMMPTKPSQEIMISIVGPATNIVIAILLALLGGLKLAAAIEKSSLTVSQSFLANLIVANIVLAVFNLVPALPMDGGRVLRSILAMKFDYLRATLWAVSIGKVIAALFIVFGFYSGDFWLALIGFFIFAGADSEKRQAIYLTMLAQRPPDLTIPPEYINLEQDDRITRR
ncbi:MAG: site-2 protease family protein [Sedimentisphaerales bacterium]|jgi:Zn-dependent protease